MWTPTSPSLHRTDRRTFPPMIEINRNPSPRELRWFGALFLLFFGLVGGVILWRFHAFGVSGWIWSGAAALTLAYYAVAPLRRPIYVGWMYATYPLGWLFTHLVLAAPFCFLRNT